MDHALLEELWPLFSAEAKEWVAAIGDGLCALERAPADAEQLDAVRRAAHNLKGAAATLTLSDIEALAHGLEECLCKAVTPAAVSAGLKVMAAIEAAVDAGDAERGASVPAVSALLAGLGVTPSVRPSGGEGEVASGPNATWARRVYAELSAALQGFQAGPAGDQQAALAAAGRQRAIERASEHDWASDGLRRAAGAFDHLSAGGPEGAAAVVAIADELVLLGQLAGREDRAADGPLPSATAPAATAGAQTAEDGPASGGARPARTAERGIRVPVATVESVTAHVCELAVGQGRHDYRARDVIALGNRLRDLRGELERALLGDAADPSVVRARLEELGGLGADAERLGREGARDAEVQRLAAHAARDDVRALRMISASVVLEPLRRTIRDVGGRLGKTVSVLLSGGDVRADRQILEGIKDALLHLVRNAVDHGLEDPDARAAAGKPTAGQLELSVQTRAGRLLVRVSDDGRGLNIERIRAKAVERGLVGKEDAQRLSDTEVSRFIFRQGFSTAQTVSEVSGRGVGLDVVHEAVSALHGNVTVSSDAGVGTRFELDLPATLASATGVVVRVGRDVAIVPADALERIVVLDRSAVVTLAGSPTLRIAGTLVPLTTLAAVLGLSDAGGGGSGIPSALILSAGGARVAVVVDEVRGFQEVVVSPLRGRLGRMQHVIGTAQLDDGRLVSVLNPGELVRRVHGADTTAAKAKRRVVVTDDSLTTRAAMKHLLEVAGFAVATAGDGEEALALLRARGGDLVVSDVQMPGMDGLELTRRIKADRALSGTPVILVTSLDAQDEREAGLRAGADAYVVKREVERGRLLELVQQLLPAEAGA